MPDWLEEPPAKALRALQKLDALTNIRIAGPTIRSTINSNGLFIEALDALGRELGLQCTGEHEGGSFYNHSGDTCPIHEWLVESDGRDALAAMTLRAFVDVGAHVNAAGETVAGPPTDEEERQLDAMMRDPETTVEQVSDFMWRRLPRTLRSDMLAAGRLERPKTSPQYPLIERLKEAGFSVKVEHKRLPIRAVALIRRKHVTERPYYIVSACYPMRVFRMEGTHPSPTGGVTIVEVKKDDKVIAVEKVVCSIDDNFVKRIGLVKALGRLTGQLYKLGIDVVP